jgi:hypothetical protein
MTISSRDQQIAAHPGVGSADSTAVTRDQARAVFGQVMGFVALTLGFLALGAYIGRDRAEAGESSPSSRASGASSASTLPRPVGTSSSRSRSYSA